MPNFNTCLARQALRSAAVFLGVLLCVAANSERVCGQLPTTTLRSLSQAFFAPGQQYEVTVRDGASTEELDTLMFSHPGFAVERLQDPPQPFAEQATPRYGSFRVTVAEDVPEGRYQARVGGRFGISNPRSILVRKDLVVLPEVGHAPQSATPLQLGHLHAYSATPRARDYYAAEVRAGQRYSVRLLGDVVDSQILGALAVLDSQGKTLVSTIGSDRQDAQLEFVAEQDGGVTIVVHDALFRGGPAFTYGLEMVTGGFGNRPAFSSQLVESISVPTAETSVVQEDAVPIALEIPAAIEAQFDQPRDQDVYLLQLAKGQAIRCEVVSDRIGQATDVRMVIDRMTGDADGRPTWQQLALSDDSPNVNDGVVHLVSRDPVLEFTAPEEGAYRIVLSDLDTGQSLGASQSYALYVSEPRREVQLLAYLLYPHKDVNAWRPMGSCLARGDSAVIRVFAIRSGNNAPIKVGFAELPDGLTCPPAWIAANQNHTDLVVSATDQVGSHLIHSKISGEYSIGEEQRTCLARFASLIWEKDAFRTQPLVRLVDDLVLQTCDKDVVPISVQVGVTEPIETEKGQQVKVPVRLQRREGGNTPVVLRAKNLPPGVKAGELTIAADASEAEWTVEITAGAPSGSYTFWAEGETKVKFAVNPQMLQRLEERLKHLQALRADPERSGEHAEIDKAIAATQQQVEAAKKQVGPRDFTLYVPMPLVHLTIK